MTPDKVEAALDVAEDIVHRLDGWDRAYPVSMFSEVTEAEREWLHTTRRGLLDRISAGMGRHIAGCIRGDIAKLREALSVLTEALAERGWRPIESAPRDGTYVLLTDNRCNPCHLIARWKFDRWWGQATPSGKSIIWTDATHWQPLPEPPHDR